MARQYSTTLRNAWLDYYETTIGTSPKLRILTGTVPANCAAAETGTLLCEIALPSDWLNAASGGTITKAGTWEGTISNTGTAGYYRLNNTANTVCHEQGSITRAFTVTTNAQTVANSNVLNFASTSGISIGQAISGAGIPNGAVVLAVASTTVTMSIPSTAGVANTTPLYFGDISGDLFLASTVLTVGQTLSISTRSITAPGA